MKADPPGELLVMLFAIAIVLVGLTAYWRTPESGGGPQHGVEIVSPVVRLPSRS